MSFPPLSECRPVEELWFEDGTVVLQAGKKLFRVYRGLLASRSSVFKDMFSFPQPSTEGPTYDGTPLVRMYDDPEDMIYFLQVVLDSSYLSPKHYNQCSDWFQRICGVLRPSHKYDVPNLRRGALQRLSRVFVTTLKERDAQIRTITSDLPSTVDTTEENTAKLLDLVPLAFEVGALWLLPHAFYMVCRHTSFEVAATHWKWDPALIRRLAKGYRCQSDAKLSYLRLGHMESICGLDCQDSNQCHERLHLSISAEFLRIHEHDEKLSMMALDLLKNIDFQDATQFCTVCQIFCEVRFNKIRQDIWDRLPSFYDLPSWEELEKQKAADLRKSSIKPSAAGKT